MAVTTFVVGAGASTAFDFPVASQLMKQICEAKTSRPDPDQYGWRQRGEEERQDAEAEAACIALAGSGQLSIDAWLSLNPNYVKWGQFAIASQLLPIEIACADKPCDDWCAWLFRKYQADRALRSEEFRIVNFNYDRSLEIALTKALVHSFNMDRDAAVSYVAELPIKHMYGHFEYPDLHRLMRGFRYTEEEVILKASEGIKVMSQERPDNDPAFSTAAKWLAEASHVVFLGFSFDALNLKRLGIGNGKVRPGAAQPNCYASAYGLLGGEQRIAIRAVSHGLRFGGDNEKCLPFLRNHVDWIG